MGHFVITFRFKYDSTYDDRYDSFKKRMEEISQSFWKQTSSFYAIQAEGTAESICYDLYLHTNFMDAKDMMVVVDLDRKKKAYRGDDLKDELAKLEKCLGF